MIKINPFFSLISFFLFSIAFSQEIAGSIYYDKLPLPDVNIKIEGTQIGTKSNKNGEFKISARKGDILIFTYVGMKTERIKIKDFNDLKINMQVSVSELEGIELKGIDKQMIESRKIITRFGEIDMDKVAYTSYGYTGEQIQSFSSIGIAEALVGRVPNLQLTNQGVILRSRDFRKQNYALWDVDGVLYEGFPPYFDPATVKSIFVIPSKIPNLRYGSRAAGGVIIVNTYRYYKNNVSLKQLEYFIQSDENNLPQNEEGLAKIIESYSSDIEELRVISFKYYQQNNKLFNLRLNRYILSKKPYDIKSYRDLAETLITQKKYINAWNNLSKYLKLKENKINSTESQIILNDMERLFHTYGIRKIYGNFETSKIPVDNFKNQVRIILEWNVPSESLELEIVNPKKQSIKFPLGNDSNKNLSIAELFINGNLLGDWKFNLSNSKKNIFKGNLKVTVYKDWLSTKKEKPDKKLFLFNETKKGYYKLFNINL